MYSPDFLSCPTMSGSPPVRSISLSDHTFSAFASSFACTSAHARPLWRFIFFSKRAFSALSSSSCCFGDNVFLLAAMSLITSYFLFRIRRRHNRSLPQKNTVTITLYFSVPSLEYALALYSSICSDCNQWRRGRDSSGHVH